MTSGQSIKDVHVDRTGISKFLAISLCVLGGMIFLAQAVGYASQSVTSVMLLLLFVSGLLPRITLLVTPFAIFLLWMTLEGLKWPQPRRCWNIAIPFWPFIGFVCYIGIAADMIATHYMLHIRWLLW